MRMIYAAATLGVLVASSAAQAQQTIVINRPNDGSPGLVGADRAAQRVSVNVQFSMPMPVLTSPSEWTKAIATASASLYEIVNQECNLLSAALHGDCRLVQINTGSNAGNRPNPGTPFINSNASVISVNANATFEVERKAPASPATPPTAAPPSQ